MCKPTIAKNASKDAGESPQWHAISYSEAAEILGVSKDIRTKGLTTAEAKRRLEEYGPNQLSEKERKTLLQRIWAQLCNVLVAILVFVAVVSLIKGIISEGESRVTNFIEVGLISFVVTLNTAIGVIQEGSAEKAAEALKSMLSSDAILVRDGKEQKVPAQEIVPGDVVILQTGDRVPGDVRLIEVNNLACQEAALTGESVPIDKIVEPIIAETGDPRQTPLGDRKNMCFSATLVSQGYGVGLVCHTGDETEIGTINKLVNKVEEKKTAVLEQIDFIAKVLACFIAVSALITWIVAFFRIGAEPLDALTIALTCAVAMIPEGLDAIVTMTYSWSVSKMAKQNAIIRKLPAVETLGSVTVICSDKTGTLTKNEMSLVAFVTSNAHYKNDVDNKNRTSKNFVRDDSYLAHRAGHAAGKSTQEVIHSGPSAHRTGKEGYGYSMHGKDSFHGAKDDGLVEDLDELESNSKPPVAADSTPVGAGEAPSQDFIRQALAGGVLCSKCSLGKDGTREGEIGNPTELSILRASYFVDIDVDGMKTGSPIIAEVPFSSEYKFMATVHEPNALNDGSSVGADEYVVHVKGAPDRMVKVCSHQAKAGLLNEVEPIDAAHWTDQIAILSSHGLRVLALCRGTVRKSDVKRGDQLKPEFVNGRDEPWLTMVGLCAIMDPPRPECVSAISEAHTAGVRVAMITGDHKDTALAIGDQLGLVDEKYSSAITGPELDAMSDEEICEAVMKYNIFARASPQNKIQIVKALQKEGQICSMTGDGVNDAPALKAADMGVAMGKEGTDVAREASEMILADDNFATIVYAVKEGRTVWDNLRKVLLINTPINNAQGMSVLFGIICGLPQAPLTPVQVLYCNLICAVTLGFVAAVEPAEDGIMNKPPRRIGKRLIGRFLLLRIIIGTTILVVTTVGSVFIVQNDYSVPQQRSQALNTLSFGACAITLSARFSYNSSFNMRLFRGNPLCWYSVAIMTSLQLLITYTPGLNSVVFEMAPMDGFQWMLVVVFMIVTFTVMEIEKAVRRYLSNLGEDTDDLEYNPKFDAEFVPDKEPLPKTHLRDELRK
ncbi:HAD superfamily P-type ATPase [Nitzschia inconspicua]|uniref:HAD superfamily P-type ATPase n=1 Tax=Nitzschia inconspicua TaxID=303405 RepID=A0A9K3L0U8_9STRA|nr:HAD superfamily P-type ATPase [Nitzschia inconspicua]